MSFIFCSLLELAAIGFLVRDLPASGPSPMPVKRKPIAVSIGEKPSPSPTKSAHLSESAKSGAYVKCSLHYPAAFSPTLYPPPPFVTSPSVPTSEPLNALLTPVANARRLSSAAVQNKYLLDLARYARWEEQNDPGRCRHCYNLLCAPLMTALTADKIDAASCIVFPTLFSIFNLCYWSYYLAVAD
jgi:hypothetical protein